MQSQIEEHAIAEAQAQRSAYAEAIALAEAQVTAEAISKSHQNSPSDQQTETEIQNQHLIEQSEENSDAKQQLAREQKDQQQDQLLLTQQHQSQERLTKQQALLLSQSLPSHILGHRVPTTIVSHSPVLLSRSPSSPVFAQDRHISSLSHPAPATIQHTFQPQIVITEPASATVQTSVVHPLPLLDTTTSALNANNFLGSSLYTPKVLSTGLSYGNGILPLSLNGHPAAISTSSIKFFNGNGNTEQSTISKDNTLRSHYQIESFPTIYANSNENVNLNGNGKTSW